jgi:Tfp pilus assembly PilM family ATPase
MKPSKDFEKALKGKEKYLILEVGNYNTKMIEVFSFPGKMVVNKGFIIATPEGTLEDDVVVKSDELIRQLSEKMKEEKITARNVTISLSSGDIITREMAIPKMNRRDTLSFIRINAKELFPVDLEDYTLGYVSMGNTDNSKLLIIAIQN